VAAAIRVAGRPWGLVAVAARGERDLPAAAAELLRDFADLVALAIDNTAIRVELERRATTDPLTGLANHRLLHEILADETARASRYGRNLSLVVLDLDRFKEINDRHGHRTGDEVLRETAHRLGLQIRAGETLARVGGEEFAWVLPETTAAQAGEAAERARHALAARPMAGVGTVTFSAGVCDLARATDSETLYRLADGALYWAKAGGRNRVVVYRPEVVEDLSAAERVDRLEHGHAQAGVRALARMVDARHSSTVGHSERVAELVSRLASARDWDLLRAVRLHDAALVHDIGKVGIADGVLLAPRALGDVEYEQVKTHPTLGAGILAEVLLEEQVAWVRHHHERWDGGGYPDGLAGDAVPEGAQLLALAEAFDVMRSERPYASALSLADALAECRAGAGSQFAPTAVEALLGLAEADLLGQAV
jgi:diguanylate cyclase (GGDEF)-like protein